VLPEDLIPLTGLEITDADADLDSLVVRPITPEEHEGWCIYMRRYHYLGCRAIVGEHLLYAAFLGDELVALLAWASPALRAPLREAYVGWDESTKRERLHLVADNVRFLVLPWVRVRHLASKILAYNLRRLSADWERTWGHPVHLAESFVDTKRFRGTCYRASNWVYLGQTAGRSKRGNAFLPGSPKALFVYPLRRDARRLLGAGSAPAGVAAASGGAALPAQASVVPSAASPIVNEVGDSPSRLPSAGPATTESGDSATPVERDPGCSAANTRSPTIAQSLAIAASALTAIGAAASKTESEPAQTTEDDLAVRFAKLHCTAGEPEEPGIVGSGQNPEGVQGSYPLDDSNRGFARPATPPPTAERRKTRIRIELTKDEKEDLQILARGLVFPHCMVVRAKAILLLAGGDTLSAAAQKVGLGRRHVRRWAERFVRKRIRGLQDAPRTGRPARFSPCGRDASGQASLRTAR
jgi:hypothetical protein